MLSAGKVNTFTVNARGRFEYLREQNHTWGGGGGIEIEGAGLSWIFSMHLRHSSPCLRALTFAAPSVVSASRLHH